MPEPKTKTSYYKRGKHKGQVKKVKTVSTDASGKITKHKVKYTRKGDVSKEKIKTSKKGVLGILGAKTKAKYTKSSGTTLAQKKGKVSGKKVAKKDLSAAAMGASGALWAGGTMAALNVGKTIGGAIGLSTATSLGSGAALAESYHETTKTSRTSAKGKVSSGNVVKSEWGKMGV